MIRFAPHGTAEFPIDAVAALAGTDFLDLHPEMQTGVQNVASFLVGREVEMDRVRRLAAPLSAAILDQFSTSNVRLPNIADRDGIMTWLQFLSDYSGDDTGRIPLRPIVDADEIVSGLELELANEIVREALEATYTGYTLQARAINGRWLFVKPTYQNAGEPAFRPYEGGKAGSRSLQDELDRVIQTYQEQGIELGLEDEASLVKLLIQLGIGIDCSNFAFRFGSLAYRRLGLPTYESTLPWESKKVLDLYESGRWSPRNEDGSIRKLTENQLKYLMNNPRVSVEWICEVFDRDNPARIVSSALICSDEASVAVEWDDVLPGDLLRFDKPVSGRTEHVAAISAVAREAGRLKITADHAWHSRGFNAGLRKDQLVFSEDGRLEWASHRGLRDPARYGSIMVRRQRSVAEYYRQVMALAA